MNIPESNEYHLRLQKDPFVRQCVQSVLDLIDEALDKHSLHMKHGVDTVENRLVHLRDYLIADKRSAQPLGQSLTLEKVNVALSLIVSIGYPGAGIYRAGLEEARDLLRESFPPATARASSPEGKA